MHGHKCKNVLGNKSLFHVFLHAPEFDNHINQSDSLVQNSTQSTCRVEAIVSPPWTNAKDNTTVNSINLNVYNTGRQAIPVPWTLTVQNSQYGAIQQVRVLKLSGCKSKVSPLKLSNNHYFLAPGSWVRSQNVSWQYFI